MNPFFLIAFFQDTLNVAEILPETESMNLLSMFSDGGILMYPILICLFITVYVIAERWRFLSNSSVDSDKVVESI